MSIKKILLVKPAGRHGLSYAFDLIPTGLEYIAASLMDITDDVTILDLEMEGGDPEEVIRRELVSTGPDLVGITMSATEHTEGLTIARLAKDMGAMTLLGGYHPTAIPNELLSYPQVDMIARGEGEITMRELVVKGRPEGVQGISYKEGDTIVHAPDRGFIEDLDTLPFPARKLRRYCYSTRLMQGREYDVLTTSRGCGGRCTFCCEPTMSRSHQRYRSPDNVMKEILEIVSYHKGRPLSIDITDPHFLGSPERVERLCDLLAQYDLNIRFGVKVRADSVANNPEIVRKMIAVGMEGFEMGIESPNMNDIRSMAKGLKIETHVRAVENIKRWGGNAGGTFVIGLPGQTEDQILAFPEYAKKIGLTSSAYGIATPFPGTRFYQDMDARGLISEKEWDRYDEMHAILRSEHMTKERIEELAWICMAKFWTVDMFIEKERMHWIRHSSKRTLYEFISEKVHELSCSLDMGSQLKSKDLTKHVVSVIESSADPNVETYTREVGVHNIIDMDHFLRVLGDQTIQLTISSRGSPVTSWIVKTTRNSIEYVQVVSGKRYGSTIDLNLDLSDLMLDEDVKLKKFGSYRIVVKMLISDNGYLLGPNMLRLLLAVITNAMSSSLSRNRGSCNSRLVSSSIARWNI